METLQLSYDERRRFSRKILIAIAELSLDNETSIIAQTRDISTGGLLVVANANVRPNTDVSIRFGIPVKDFVPIPVQVAVTVVYCTYSGIERGFKLGMRFSHISHSSAHLIERYINS